MPNILKRTGGGKITGNQQNMFVMKAVSTETCLNGSFPVPIVVTADAYSAQILKKRLEIFKRQ